VDNLVIRCIKKAFYRIYPTTHISAFLRTIYLQRYIRRFQFTRVLDAGCGTGQFTLYLARKYPHAEFTGYDLSEKAIKTSVASRNLHKLHNADFQKMDLFELNQKSVFDLIYSIDVLEHIVGNMKVIHNLDSALRKGGILYIAMPYEKDHRFLFPAKFHQRYVQWSAVEHGGDQYSLEEWKTLLQNLGYEIIISKRTFGMWGKLAWEMDLVLEGNKVIKRLLLPFLLCLCCLDIIWKNGRTSYALLIVARKNTE